MNCMYFKTDKWYKMQNSNCRHHFIDIVKRAHPDVKASIKIYSADCLKYNSNTNTICYKTTYNEKYDYGMDTYCNDNLTENMEEIKMTSEPFIKNDPILENYFSKQNKAIEQKAYNDMQKIVENTELGKAAIKYLEVRRLTTENCPSLQELVPVYTLSKMAQDMISQIHEKANQEQQKLRETYEEVRYLLSIADTYEQKERLYKKYGMLTTLKNKSVSKLTEKLNAKLQ